MSPIIAARLTEMFVVASASSYPNESSRWLSGAVPFQPPGYGIHSPLYVRSCNQGYKGLARRHAPRVEHGRILEPNDCLVESESWRSLD